METVEVLVRIPKKDFEELQSNYVWWGKHGEYIKRGTVLPKGHGKLFDSNVLWDAYQDLGQDFYEAFDFAEANAIIEADKEVDG